MSKRAVLAALILFTTSAVLFALTGIASASALGVSWHPAGDLTAGAITGLSCSSRSLCVAVNSSGDALSSVTPAAGARSWSTAAIDASNPLDGVACPSAALCVAVDDAGNLLTSTDPAAGIWTSADLEGDNGFAGVACPSASVCVAATGSDLRVSLDPAAGASSWEIFRNADQTVGPECGKYGGNTGCAESLTFLSCASSSRCVAVDGDGGTVSGDPFTGTWTSTDGPGIETEGLACLTDGSCLTECAAGTAVLGLECASGAYDATDLCGSAGCSAISDAQLSGFWCPSVSLCYSAEEDGTLIASARPTGGASAWTTVYASPDRNATDPVTGVSCPGLSLCVAVKDGGELLLGSPLPGAAGPAAAPIPLADWISVAAGARRLLMPVHDPRRRPADDRLDNRSSPRDRQRQGTLRQLRESHHQDRSHRCRQTVAASGPLTSDHCPGTPARRRSRS